MKKNLLTLFTICLAVFNLQSQTWAWGRKFPAGQAEASDVSTDASGNAYISGQFTGPLVAGQEATSNEDIKKLLQERFRALT